MTTENGATVGDENVNNEVETNEGQSGGDNANTGNTELEALKAEIASRDSKIAKLLEKEKLLAEIEAKRKQEEFERKSEKEQLEHLKQQMDAMNRRAQLAQELEGTGVSVDIAEKIMAGDVSEGSKTLKEIIATATAKAQEEAVERLKAEMRGQATKDIPAKTNETEDAFTKGFGQGAGF